MTVHLESTTERRVELLRGSGLWATLSDSALHALAAAMRPARYAVGEFIIRHGEPGRHLHVLTEGEADVRVHTGSGSAISVNIMQAGACFGEMSLLSGDLTSADVVAKTACETLVLDRPAFDALMAGEPQLLREFVRMVATRLRESNAATGAARQREQEVTRFLQDARAERVTELAGRSPAMRALRQQVSSIAEADGPVLIEGEPGTGKELIARLIHVRGARREGPLLSAHCARISETPWGDRLFGDYRGTGEHGQAPPVSFLELAAGGTIVLKDIDALPRPIQERLAMLLGQECEPAADGQSTVGVIATCRHRLADLVATNGVSAALARALAPRTLVIPPLRDRKRDIPELAAHFAREYAERLHKPVPALDEQALRTLVTFDYASGNVRELEEAIQRAVTLTDGDRIDADVIFLGQPPDASHRAFNLLSLSKSVVRPALRIFPRAVQVVVAVVFAFILYGCLFVPAGRVGTWSNALVWSAWWPALALSFFFAGRAWCAVCPMSSAAVATQRLYNRKVRVPAWMKRDDTLIFMAGFFAIVWVEEATAMRQSPRATGLLLLAILLGAVGTALLLPRRTWCRYLCPLAGLAGVSSMTSLLELRPTADICAARCTEHSCFKGADGVEGCPMFNHVMFLDSNRHCVLCLDCLRTCPNDSPQLNLRLPALDLLTLRADHPMVGRLTMLLGGLLVAVALLHHWNVNPNSTPARLLRDHRVLVVTAALAAAALVSQVLLWAAAPRDGDPASTGRFWQKVTAWVPTITAGFIAHQLNFIPGLDAVRITITSGQMGGSAGATATALSVVQALVVCTGLAVTAGVQWKVAGRSA